MERVEIARQLEKLPQTQAAFASGLSLALMKVRAAAMLSGPPLAWMSTCSR